MAESAAQQLVKLIAKAVQDIEEDISARIPGGKPTDVNLPQVAPEEQIPFTPQRREAIRTLKAATHQLLATLMPVGLQVQDLHYGYFQTVAIGIVVEGRIADLIHSIDPDSSKGGVHVELLAEKAGMDPRKLTHTLRFLALRNMFAEIRPDCWGNTRSSFPLRTDSVNSQWNYLKTNREHTAIPALNELPKLFLDVDGGGAASWDISQTAFQKHFKPDCGFFEFLEKSENGWRAEMFGKSMVELPKATGAEPAEYEPYDWNKLGPEGILIDVGGGIGGAAYDISTYLPQWKLVVQDRAQIVKNGKENYIKKGSSANIEFEEVDFFKDQPLHRTSNADVYLLRRILHDWSSTSCVEILTRLRKSAKPRTRLLIIETRMVPGLVDPNSPILSNGGMGSSLAHNLNLGMLTLFNSEERTKDDFEVIFNKSGWILNSVTPLASFLDWCIFEGLPNPHFEL
ncbi:hypothetical protein MJO28_008860 [Puccinia striiformis f. sp. tritici]|nr:hypothetical protein Pst134EA_015098 [Puccinia striiformis f. sp. tritici]KAI9603172.1 hypothetical protein H4Q26_002487 [Puccinia striiformis f. sp. tritici PST-130]KNE91177.1 hypothetical protein PSTG_15382 [Puccinia striiformis f. sp. tritici PST-78]POW16790.1 hypothetical protein PSTT_01079 [Puccinia striiformis]KAH9452268.1 hypothetical protein Pst134EB_016223 [Puccinia striiformis f. sp. tritici]KAH9463010.1 hypothetical protein Pst134EA_015098 [Puccinia striiformis f. sp. tritici]